MNRDDVIEILVIETTALALVLEQVLAHCEPALRERVIQSVQTPDMGSALVLHRPQTAQAIALRVRGILGIGPADPD